MAAQREFHRWSQLAGNLEWPANQRRPCVTGLVPSLMFPPAWEKWLPGWKLWRW